MSFNSSFLRTTYWMRDFLHGSPVGHHYKDIRTILTNPVQGEIIRRSHLDRILKHAVTHSPFYSGFDERDLHTFPVLSRADIMENSEKITVSTDKIPGQTGDIFIQRTSGSTGKPLAVYQDTQKRYRRIAELKYFGLLAGFRSHEKLVQLRAWNRWQTKTSTKSRRENIIPFNVSKIKTEDLDVLCSIINKKNVVAIRGYASSLGLLAQYATDHNICFPRLKVMIAVSEVLSDRTRDLVRNSLHCNIISQYANEENGILGQERVMDNHSSPFFLNHASYFFEVLNLEKDEPAAFGEPGRIVITDFFNFAFPMIRYNTGDVGTLQPEAEDSYHYPVIEKLLGRRWDMIYDVNGDIVYPMALSRVLKHFSGITQWQFIQNGKNDYQMKLATNGINVQSDSLLLELKNLFGENAAIKMDFVTNIPPLASGKHKAVVNNQKE